MALAAGDYSMILQAIEGNRTADLLWGTANAKQIIIQFDVNFSYFSSKYFGIAVRNGAADRSYVTNYLVPGSSPKFTYTAIVPGDTTGTWYTDTRAGIVVSIVFGAGTTFKTANENVWQAGNFLASTANTGDGSTGGQGYSWSLSRFGLYADPYKTGRAPPFVLPDIISELRLCQRYWCKVFGMRGIMTDATHAERGGANVPASMRISPALAVFGAPRWYDGAATGAATSIVSNYSGQCYLNNHVHFGVVLNAALTAGRACSQYWDADTNYVAADARY